MNILQVQVQAGDNQVVHPVVRHPVVGLEVAEEISKQALLATNQTKVKPQRQFTPKNSL